MAHLESPMLFFEPGQRVWMQLGQIRRSFRSMDSSFSRLIHRGVPLRQSGRWLVGTPIISFDDFPTGLPNSPILYGWLCIPLYPGWWFGRFLIFPNSWDDPRMIGMMIQSDELHHFSEG